MKQVEFLWDTGSDMIVLARNVNARLEEFHKRHFKVLEIKEFGNSSIDIKGGLHISDYKIRGIIICIVYDDNR
jgi:hypothetical protein